MLRLAVIALPCLAAVACGRPPPAEGRPPPAELRFSSADSMTYDQLMELARTCQNESTALELIVMAEMRAALKAEDRALREQRLNTALAGDALRRFTASRTEQAAQYWMDQYKQFDRGLPVPSPDR